MPITFSCSCGKVFRVPESAAGKRAKCPKCGSVIVVPQPERKAEPATEEDAEPRPPAPAARSDRGPASSGSGKRPPLGLTPGSGEPRRPEPDRPVFDDRA